MADFTALKTAIQNAIKQNGNEEITGNILQDVLLAIVSTLGDGSINDLITALGSEATTRQQADGTLQQNIDAEATTRGNADTALGGRIDGVIESINAINTAIGNGYVYAGIATPSSTPTTGKVFYLALTAGTYTNFGNIAVTQGINILKNNGSTWSLDSFLGIDDAPTPSSNNLVKSGGVFNDIMTNGSAFDLSAYNNGTTYADLNAALTALNALPAAYKKGGMSMKYVQTSDNKYVQYRLMSDTFNTTPANWQGVDDEPKDNSKNLVESGAVYYSIGLPITKSETASGTSIDCRIDRHFERGSKLFIISSCDNSNMNYLVRAHKEGTSNFQVFKANDKTSLNSLCVLEDDVDYIQAVNYTSAIDGTKLSLSIYTSVNAVVKSLEKTISETPLDAINSSFALVNFNTNPPVFSYNSDTATFEITLYTTGSDNKIVGYLILPDGVQVSMVGTNNGSNTYTIPRLSNLIVNPDNGQLQVVENSGVGRNVILFRNVITGLQKATGPLADYLKYLQLSNRIDTNDNNIDKIIDRFTYNESITEIAENSSVGAIVKHDFHKGEYVHIIASTDTQQPILTLRVRKTDNSYVTIDTFKEGEIIKDLYLDYDINRIELVNYVSAVNGSEVSLSVLSGVYESELFINKKAVGFKYSVSATASSGSVNAQINQNFEANKPIYLTVDNDNPSNSLVIRAHANDGTFISIETLSDSTHYEGIFVPEKECDYIQAVRFVSAIDGTNVTLNIYPNVYPSIEGAYKEVDKTNERVSVAESNQSETYLPEYYKEYMKEKITAIRDSILSTEGESITFAFLTDSHWNKNSCKSPLIVSELMKHGLTRTILFGGDVCSAYTPIGSDWVQPKEIEKQMTLNGMSNDYGFILNARGNHDFNGSKNNIIPGQPGADTYIWSIPVTRSLLTSSLSQAVVNSSDTNCTYYYVDDNVRKIRFFVLFAVERTAEFSAEQEEWFINAVTNIPSGYDIIIMNHDNCEPTVGLQCPTLCPDIKQLVDAINLKASGITTTNNKPFNFASITAKVLLFISGHTHHDLQTFNNECVYICTRADALYGSAAFLGEDEFTRSRDSVSEQAVDFVIVDKGNGNVLCRRIGCGADRLFRAGIKSVNIGSTLTLTSILSGTLTWGSYNNDTPWHEGDVSHFEEPCTPENTRVSVLNGVVTGIATGQSVVYAKDANGNREFFNIVVS